MGIGSIAIEALRRRRLRPKDLLFGFIGLMFVYVLIHNESFLVNPHDPEWQHIASFKWWLLPHGLAGACALLLGPLQFSDCLRQRHVGLHHAVGRICIAGTFIAAPLGVYIQHRDERLGCARSSTIETVIQASLWMLTTGMALACIRKGKVQQHRQWMARSFAAGSFVFMADRVIDGLFGLGASCGTDEIVVWCCTASSIFLADAVLQLGDFLGTRPLASQAQADRRVAATRL